MNNTKSELATVQQFVLGSKVDDAKVFHFNKMPLRDVIIGKTSLPTDVSYENRLSSKFHVLEYVLCGEGEIIIDQKKYKLKPNQTVLIQKGTLHTIHSNPQNPIEKIWIAFSCNYLNSMLVDFSLTHGVYLIDTMADFQTLHNLSLADQDSSIVFFIVEKLHSILANIGFYTKEGSSKENLLYLIKIKLNALTYSKGTLDDVAQELNVSKATIIRTFKKEYGVTPYKYLLDKKLEMAKEYLKNSKISIKNIALMLSFVDEHYFTFLFTKKNGTSPSEYRKMFSF